jgi:DnaJ-class molecular chaperone
MQDVDKYTEIQCERCDGAGTSYDPTNADKVNPDPRGNQCPRCAGRGHRLILTTSITKPGYVPSGEPIGEMPDWMC